MEIFGLIFAKIMGIMTMNFTLFGYTFSLWNVFVVAVVFDLIAWVVGEVVLGD